MRGPAARLHPELRTRISAVLTEALRADIRVIDAVVPYARGIDPRTALFLRESRRLVLGCGAALWSVLDVHRPWTGPVVAGAGPVAPGTGTCRECGGHECATLGGIRDVLDAYTMRPGEAVQGGPRRCPDGRYGRPYGPGGPGAPRH